MIKIAIYLEYAWMNIKAWLSGEYVIKNYKIAILIILILIDIYNHIKK